LSHNEGGCPTVRITVGQPPSKLLLLLCLEL